MTATVISYSTDGLPSCAADSFDDKAVANVSLSLLPLQNGKPSCFAEFLIRPTDIRCDESGEHPDEDGFVLFRLSRMELRAILAFVENDWKTLQQHCPGLTEESWDEREEIGPAFDLAVIVAKAREHLHGRINGMCQYAGFEIDLAARLNEEWLADVDEDLIDAQRRAWRIADLFQKLGTMQEFHRWAT